MPIIEHVAERNIKRKTAGGFRFGENQGILVDADLSSATAAKAAVDTDVAKLHVSERRFGNGVKKAIDQADNYLSGATTGTDVSNVYDLAPAARDQLV